MYSLEEPKVIQSYKFGIKEIDGPNKEPLKGINNLFSEKISQFTTIKSLTIWSGTPPEEKNINSFLGIQVTYLNYITGEKKTTEYQGSLLTENNIIKNQLDIEDNDYLSKINIGFNKFITHLKFTTKKGKFIEFGTIDEFEKVSVEEINKDDNIILNITGDKSLKGIKYIGVDYMPFVKFFFNRLIHIFRLRHKINNEDKEKYQKKEEINKLNYEMKCILKFCQLPDSCFASIIKFL